MSPLKKSEIALILSDPSFLKKLKALVHYGENLQNSSGNVISECQNPQSIPISEKTIAKDKFSEKSVTTVLKVDYETNDLCIENITSFLKDRVFDKMSIQSLFERDTEKGYIYSLSVLNIEGEIFIYGQMKASGSIGEASVIALEKSIYLASLFLGHFKEIEILSNSPYAVNSISKWAFAWEKNNWRKKRGAIKNLEHIKEAHRLWKLISLKSKIEHREQVEYGEILEFCLEHFGNSVIENFIDNKTMPICGRNKIGE